MSKSWNRSSAFSPEQLGILNSLTSAAIQDAIARFEKAIDGFSLSEEQRAEAIQMLAAGVTDGMTHFVERLKSGVTVIDCGTV